MTSSRSCSKNPALSPSRRRMCVRSSSTSSSSFGSTTPKRRVYTTREYRNLLSELLQIDNIITMWISQSISQSFSRSINQSINQSAEYISWNKQEKAKLSSFWLLWMKSILKFTFKVAIWTDSLNIIKFIEAMSSISFFFFLGGGGWVNN